MVAGPDRDGLVAALCLAGADDARQARDRLPSHHLNQRWLPVWQPPKHAVQASLRQNQAISVAGLLRSAYQAGCYVTLSCAAPSTQHPATVAGLRQWEPDTWAVRAAAVVLRA